MSDKKSKEVAIIFPGILPVPSVLGGAAESLITESIESYIDSDFKISIYSIYNKEALDRGKRYKNINFKYIKIPHIILFFDYIIGKISKLVLRKKSQIRKYVTQIYYLLIISYKINRAQYQHILFESSIPLLYSVKFFFNYKKYRMRYSFHIHNVPTIKMKDINIYKNIYKVICVSEFLESKVLEVSLPIRKNDLTCVLHNKINTHRFSYMPNGKEYIKEKHNIEKENRIILFAGRLRKEKGFFEVIKAFDQLQFNDINLLIIGSLHFKNSTNDLKLPEEIEYIVNNNKKIVFTGYIDNQLMPLYYSSAYVSVLPSISDEAAGLTILESMSCGTPVITTKNGGIVNYINENVSIIVDNNSNLLQSLVESLSMILTKSDLRADLSRKSLLHVTENYDNRDYLDNLLKFLL